MGFSQACDWGENVQLPGLEIDRVVVACTFSVFPICLGIWEVICDTVLFKLIVLYTWCMLNNGQITVGNFTIYNHTLRWFAASFILVVDSYLQVYFGDLIQWLRYCATKRTLIVGTPVASSSIFESYILESRFLYIFLETYFSRCEIECVRIVNMAYVYTIFCLVSRSIRNFH